MPSWARRLLRTAPPRITRRGGEAVYGGTALGLVHVVCHGRDAIAGLAALKDEPGLPLILGAPADVAALSGHRRDAPAPDRILADADRIDGQAWLAEERARRLAELGDEAPDEIDMTPMRGDWPEWRRPAPASEAVEAVARRALGPGYRPELIIAAIPAHTAHEIPAHLGITARNTFPGAAVQVAIQRHWADRHGARLVAHTRDVLTFTVEHPPENRTEALALAMEHYTYCPATVDQGADTLDALAAALIDAQTWYFWWD